jgi:hypothetical protein
MTVLGLRRSQTDCAPRGASCTGPAACPFAHIHARMCANGHATCSRKEHPVENILLAFFFVELGKWETRPYKDRLPLPPMRDARS